MGMPPQKKDLKIAFVCPFFLTLPDMQLSMLLSAFIVLLPWIGFPILSNGSPIMDRVMPLVKHGNLPETSFFQVCRPLIQSPESNGMVESCVKTFKRNYVALHFWSDGLTIMKQLFHRFKDYNERHPRKGLKMWFLWEFSSSYLA